MSKTLPTSVLLATEDSDIGIVPGFDAVRFAKQYANREQVTIRIRDVITDRVLVVIDPEEPELLSMCCGAPLSDTHHPYCMKCGADQRVIGR
jgi:hypothetical protein